MVRILFLDLDGVICCNMHGELERDKLFQVRKICNATNAKVVLSTDWRRRADLRRRAEQTLSALGVECIGATPEYVMYSRVRPKEIVAWMNGCKEPIEGWVAIDDRDLVLEEGAVVRGQNVFSNHFVLTEFHSGLTTALADLAVAHCDIGCTTENAGTAVRQFCQPPQLAMWALVNVPTIGERTRAQREARSATRQQSTGKKKHVQRRAVSYDTHRHSARMPTPTTYDLHSSACLCSMRVSGFKSESARLCRILLVLGRDLRLWRRCAAHSVGLAAAACFPP